MRLTVKANKLLLGHCCIQSKHGEWKHTMSRTFEGGTCHNSFCVLTRCSWDHDANENASNDYSQFEVP